MKYNAFQRNIGGIGLEKAPGQTDPGILSVQSSVHLPS